MGLSKKELSFRIEITTVPSTDPAFIVLQIATPFSTGTGFYLPGHDLVVTNEHVVRDNPTALVTSPHLERCLMPVVYLDSYYDLAFLRPERSLMDGEINIASELPGEGTCVIAMGQNYGKKLQQTDGEVLDVSHLHHEIPYLQHNARLKSAQSGGPLFNEEGTLIGVNMYDIDEGHQLALSLPSTILLKCLEEFAVIKDKTASRCFECQRINFEPVTGKVNNCRSCGAEIVLPRDVPDHQPTGIQATIEQIIATANFDPRMARRGPNLWEIYQGSARIQLAYHEDSGLITGDAHLCLVPEGHPAEIYEYLLRQNYELNQLTFSTHGREIVLSLLIYDRYLTVDSGLPQFRHLFDRADHYDNHLVEKFGATWE